MFGTQSKAEAAKEILAFTATANPAARQRIQRALAAGTPVQQVARAIRNAKKNAQAAR
jgi:superfamily II DNA helicase RecQ